MNRRLPPPFTLVALSEVDSTNDEARRLAEQGAGHGTVVWAAAQTAGRGRRGRVWQSPPGNLCCSLLLDGGPEAAAAPQLAFVAAVALRDALAELAPAADFRLKWPNDVLCRGAKIAGMLLEKAGGLVILGVGVNIRSAPAVAPVAATCLERTGSRADAFDLLAVFCAHLLPWYDRWRQDGFAPLRRAWLDRAAGVGGPVAARLADDSVMEGRFADLDEDGALILTNEMGRPVRVLAGDVFFRHGDDVMVDPGQVSDAAGH